MNKWCAITFVSLFLGCSYTKTSSVITGRAHAPHHGEVKVLMDGAPIPENAEEVGLVQATGYVGNANLASVIDGLRQEASRLGCDTVARVKVDQGSAQASANGVCLRGAAGARASH